LRTIFPKKQLKTRRSVHGMRYNATISEPIAQFRVAMHRPIHCEGIICLILRGNMLEFRSILQHLQSKVNNIKVPDNGEHQFFYPRDAMLVRVYALCASVCLSVRVTRVLSVKTAKDFVEILLPPDSSIILVFRYRGSLLNSDGFTPNRDAEYKGGVRKWAIFEWFH